MFIEQICLVNKSHLHCKIQFLKSVWYTVIVKKMKWGNILLL
jgi:hypothetical protein